MGGYNRSDLEQIRVAAEQVKIDLTQSIKANVGVQSITRDPLPLQNDSKPADPIYLNDLVPDVGIEIKALPDVPDYDPKKATDNKPDNPQAQIENHDNSVNAYMQADQRVKNEFLAELKNVDPQVGAAVEGAMPMPGGTSGLAMIGSLADDAILPGAGDIWRAIDDIMSQTSNPNSERVQAAISQTISNLQSHAADQKASSVPGAAKPIQWDNLHPDPKQAVNQMQNFLMRDPKQDPLMRTLLENEPKLEKMQKNWEKRQDFEAGEVANVEVGAIVQAVDAGDRGLVQTLVGGEQEAEKAMQGDVVAAVKKEAPASRAVESFAELGSRLEVSGISGVKTNLADISDLDEGARDVAKIALNLEPIKNMMKPDYSMNAGFG